MGEQRDLSPAELTRKQLLDAAESLFLAHGFDNVSVRSIIREAGQKNQSALQYHFGNRDGLIMGIQVRRMQQVETRRRVLIDAALMRSPRLELRSACALMMQAPFILCREDRSFREFLGLFGLRLIASNQMIKPAIELQNSDSLAEMNKVILGALSHLDSSLLTLREENANSLGVLAIARRAHLGGSFRGPQAELFFNNLIDQIAAMLLAPVSDDTAAFLKPRARSPKAV
jgi:AcrR family transcriptional regulator